MNHSENNARIHSKTKYNAPPWTILWFPTPSPHHGLHIQQSVLHSVFNHRGTMVQMEWGPYRDKFHQYILSNLSNILTTTVQPNLNISFTADLAVPIAEQDSLAATNGSSKSDTHYQPSLTDTTLFTAEIWLYCGILFAVIVVLIVSGVCHTIHLVTNQSTTHSPPPITQGRRPISQPIPPLRPLLSNPKASLSCGRLSYPTGCA